MKRPSDTWLGLQGLDSTSEQFKKIERILVSANFNHLKGQAIHARQKHQPHQASGLTCTIELTRFASGYNNLVLEVAFSDGVFWVARIMYRMDDPSTPDEERISTLSEIATMNYIRHRTDIPLPQVFHFELSAEQPFGYPYMLMECMPGSGLEGPIACSIPGHFQAKVAQQLANILIQLQSLTFDRIGRLWCGESTNEPVSIIPMAWHRSPGPLDTSFEFYYNKQRSNNTDMSKMYPNDADRLTAGWVLISAIPHFIIGDRVRGPFPLCHLDLHFGNLLFDDEYNISGVVDWSNVQTAPLEQLTISSEVGMPPAADDETKQSMSAFTNLLVQALKDLESHSPLNVRSPPLSEFMASRRREIALYCFMNSPHNAHIGAKLLAQLMYGSSISWEQLREVYGTIPFS